MKLLRSLRSFGLCVLMTNNNRKLLFPGLLISSISKLFFKLSQRTWFYRFADKIMSSLKLGWKVIIFFRHLGYVQLSCQQDFNENISIRWDETEMVIIKFRCKIQL